MSLFRPANAPELESAGEGVEPDAPRADEEYLLSGSEAALATTLALMTGFAHGCCDAHRASMAQRVAHQLGTLAHGMHGAGTWEGMSGGMQTLLARLAQRWQATAQHSAAALAATAAVQPPAGRAPSRAAPGDVFTTAAEDATGPLRSSARSSPTVLADHPAGAPQAHPFGHHAATLTPTPTPTPTRLWHAPLETLQ